MNTENENDSDLDELQKSIEESVAKVTKIDVTSHDDDQDTDEPDTVGEAQQTEDTDEQDSDTGADEVAAEPEKTDEEIQREIEKEFSEDDVEDIAEDEEKKAGPAGPYQPVVPGGGSGSDGDEMDDSTDNEDVFSEEKDVATDTAKDDDTSDDEAKPSSEKSVDEAVDDLLSVEPQAAQAAAAAEAAAKIPEKKKRFPRVRRFFSSWWHNKRLRYGTFAGLFILFTAVVFIPVTRYAALNLFGVRVNTTMQILDSETGLPLENIPVTLADKTIRSGEEGFVEFTEVKLGNTKLVIDKLGYATFSRDLTLGLGSNPLGPLELVATGAQFKFSTTDWLSDAVLVDAEATSGEDIAQADEQGNILLTVGDLSELAEVRITAPGYRDETFLLTDLSEEVNEVTMVPSKKHFFVSNRDGEYDLYKIDVDGQNEELLLEASGKEREIPFVLPHQERDIAAYITSRDGEVNSGGFVLDGLYIVDATNNSAERITRSEQLQIIGWVDSKLVYVAVVEGVSAGNSQRSKVFSYDVETKERFELAAANYFNDVKIVESEVYYAVSSAAVPQSQAKLYKTDVEGTSSELVVDTQVWNIIREDYNTLLFSAIDREWYRQTIGQSAEKLESPPTSRESRRYATSPDKKRAVWTDVRDGKGVLLSYVVESEQEELILTKAGLGSPVYWIDDSYVVFRVTTSDETADYILHLDSKRVEKISDVVGNQSRFFF